MTDFVTEPERDMIAAIRAELIKLQPTFLFSLSDDVIKLTAARTVLAFYRGLVSFDYSFALSILLAHAGEQAVERQVGSMLRELGVDVDDNFLVTKDNIFENIREAMTHTVVGTLLLETVVSNVPMSLHYLPTTLIWLYVVHNRTDIPAIRYMEQAWKLAVSMAARNRVPQDAWGY